MLTIIATLVLLGVLIFVHELGHFITAKLVDIRVPRFSIGFGPKIVGFRRGETEYVLSWLPLGGYVKMAGMEEMEAIEGGEDEEPAGDVPVADLGALSEETDEPGDPSRNFEAKSLPARFLVISAGVIMNFLFAALLWAVIAGVWGVPEPVEPTISRVRAESLPEGTRALAELPEDARLTAVGDQQVAEWQDVVQAIATSPPGPLVLRFQNADAVRIELPEQDRARRELASALVPHWDAVLASVFPGDPAAEAGLREGDRIVAIEGRAVESYMDLSDAIASSPEQPVRMLVQRGADTLALTVTPVAEQDPETGETTGRIGIASSVPRDRMGPIEATAYGLEEAGRWSVEIVNVLARLVTGRESARNLGGPVMIGDLAGQFARAGLEHFLNFMAIFSINLAVLNLLPIPVLDGGHLLFLTIEGVRGRALSLKQRMRMSQVGLVIIVAIMVLALANDLLRLVERFVGG